MASRTITDYQSYVNEPDNTKLDDIPGDAGLPILGHTIPFLADPLKWAQKQYKKYGPVVKVNTMGMKGVLVLGPDLTQKALLDLGGDFSSRMGFVERAGKFFGDNSLIMEDFDHHKHQRRIMQGAFKVDSLKLYTEQINDIYQRAMQDWQADAGHRISFLKHIKGLLLEVAGTVFIGIDERGEQMTKVNKAFVDCANGTIYMFPLALPGTALYKGLKGRKFLLEYFRELLPKRRAGNGKDMLSSFCNEIDEDGNFYTDQEVMDQMIFLMFAAHDTTTAAITHTIYYLAKHPEVKEKLYQECKALGKDRLDYDDLDAVPYMQQVFYEVQRLRPSAPVFPRRTIRDVQMGDTVIPAHTLILIMSRFTHHMDEYWTEPDKFDPERFSPERSEQKQHPFLYHPFGGGAHKCIGLHFSQMEYKCFMYQFLLKYDFQSRHKKDPHMMTLPIPKPGDGMPVELLLR